MAPGNGLNPDSQAPEPAASIAVSAHAFTLKSTVSFLLVSHCLWNFVIKIWESESVLEKSLVGGF